VVSEEGACEEDWTRDGVGYLLMMKRDNDFTLDNNYEQV
jgi:hypothetical protein